MVEIKEEVHECPFCHGKDISKVENDQYNDLYYCSGCNHRFRHDPMVNFTNKQLAQLN